MTTTPGPAEPTSPGAPTADGTAARPEPSPEARRALRNAWISVAAIPVAIIVAMVVGQGIASLLGFESGGDDLAPVGTMLAAGLPAVLIMIAPTVPAMLFGFRARRLGLSTGIIPAVIGIAAAVWAVLANLLPALIALA